MVLDTVGSSNHDWCWLRHCTPAAHPDLPYLQNNSHHPLSKLNHHGLDLLAQWMKNLLAMQKIQEMRLWSLGQEDPLEEGMAAHSSILTWRIPWTEEPGRRQSMGSQRLRRNWVTNTFTLGWMNSVTKPSLLPFYVKYSGLFSNWYTRLSSLIIIFG